MSKPIQIPDGVRFVVLSGGEGPESKVSLSSGKAVYDAISSFADCELITMERDELPAGLNPDQDIIVPMIHGVFGEDGTLQNLLEEGGFQFAGTGSSASRLCFDKIETKDIARTKSIPVVEDLKLAAGQQPNLSELLDLGTQWVYKPCRQGSSVGVLLGDERNLNAEALLPNEEYLVESYFEGKDVTVGILHGRSLGVVGIVPKEGFYDYKNKYTAGNTDYEVPAEIDPLSERQMREWSAIIYEACGCRDFARADFRINSDGEAVFLEINTIPGMTETSLFPKTASIFNYSFNSLIKEMIKPAVTRFLNQGERV